MTTLPVHPGADAVLDAPRPRAARGRGAPDRARCACWRAPAPARPGPSPTASPTACSPGVYQPQRVLAVTFTARAAGEMRTRLRDLGVGGVQARTFHAAALRQLHYFWPQAIGGALRPRSCRTRPAPSPRPAAGCGCGFDRTGDPRPRLRDRVGQGLACSPPSRTPPRPRPQRREPPAASTPRPWLASSRPTRRSRPSAGVIDFEDVLLLMVGILREHDESPGPCASQYRHFVVDEYQDVNPLQQRLLDALARRSGSDLCVVGDPAQTIYSFTGASPGAPARLPHPPPRGPHGRAGAQLPLDPTGRRPGQPRAARPRRAAPQRLGRAARRSARRPRARAARRRQRPRRGGRRRHPHRRPRRGRAPARPRSPCSSAPTARARPFESALAERGIPYLVRGGERFFSRKEVRDAIVLMRGAARSDDGSVPLPDLARDVLLGAGWTRQRAHQRRGRPRAVGVLSRRWRCARRRPASPSTPRRGCRPSCASSTSAWPRRSTPPRSRASPSPRSTRPRAWSGTRSSSSACSDGLLPITMADTPEAVEEERRLLYVGRHPGPRAPGHLLRRGPHPGRAGHPASVPLPRRHGRRARRGGPLAAQALVTRGWCGRPVGQGPAAQHLPHVWRRPRARPPSAPSAAARPARRPRRGACSSAARVAAGDRARRRRAGLRRVHRRHPDRDRRADSHRRAGLSAISGVGQRKLDLYGTDVLALLAGGRPPPATDSEVFSR